MHVGEVPALLSIQRGTGIRDRPFTCPQYVLIGSNSMLLLIQLLIISRIPPLNNKFYSMEGQKERVLNSKNASVQELVPFIITEQASLAIELCNYLMSFTCREKDDIPEPTFS